MVAVLVLTMALVPVGRAVAGTGSGHSAVRVGDTYMVRSGDTLWDIASTHGYANPRLGVDAIMAANQVDPGTLLPGQAITIPPA